MTTSLSQVAIQDFFINGVPATGGKLYVYQAGTTTKITVYTDSSGITTQTNPVVMNSRGEPQNAMGASVGIWISSLSGPYKLVFSPSTDTDPPTNPIWTVDNVALPGGTTTLFDLPFEFPGVGPAAGGVVGIYVAVRSQRFFANFAGSAGIALVNPTATVGWTVYRNASEVIGTIAISTGGVWSFTTTGGVSFDLTAGQYLRVVNTGGTDATLANSSWTFTGYDL